MDHTGTDRNAVYLVRTGEQYRCIPWGDVRRGRDHAIVALASVGAPVMHVDYLYDPSFINAPRQSLQDQHFRPFHTFDKVTSPRNS